MNTHPHRPRHYPRLENDHDKPQPDPVIDPTSSRNSAVAFLASRLERRIRHLEATADYVQGLEERAEGLEREVRDLHHRMDEIAQLLARSSSPVGKDTNGIGSCDSKHTPSLPQVRS